MVNKLSKRSRGDDEGNADFGLPAKVVDLKPGFDSEVVERGVETGTDRRLRPREEKDIPKETLAARIAKIQ